MVYSQPKEGREIQRHISYLQDRGYLLENHETIDLEDLPGVRGLRAIRARVNLEAAAAVDDIGRMAG